MIGQYLSNTNESDTVSIFQKILKTKPKSIIKSVQTPKQVERYLLVLEFGWSAMTFFTSDESEAHQNRTYQQRHIHHIPWAHPAIRPPELNEAGPCLVPSKFCKIFYILRHIESLDACMEY